MFKLNKFIIFFVFAAFLFIYDFAFALEKQQNKIQSNDWINPDLDYVKLSTDADAPAVVSMGQILDVVPKWLGLNSNYLHLLHFNNEVKFYLKDDDGLIGPNDTLFFLGSRSVGDTTFWDNYATEEPFFLTYNISFLSERLQLIPNTLQFLNNLNYIYVNNHLEKDFVRSVGKDLYDSHNSDNEGWYWKEIVPEENQPTLCTFSTFLNIESDNVEDIEIKVFFKSINDTLIDAIGSNKYPEYRLSLFFNNDSIDVKEFTRIRKDSFMLVFNPQKVINGVNSITLKSKEVHPYRHGVISIAYITLKYNSKPLNSEFLTNFYLTNISQPSQLNLDGFSSSGVISIDSLNGKIQFPETANSNLKLNISLKENAPMFAVSWDDTACVNFNSGFHILRISSKERKVTDELFLDYYASTFKELLGKADSEDVFVLGYNSADKINVEFINDLIDIGILKSFDIKAGDNWIFVFTKKKVIYNNIFQNNIANINLELALKPYPRYFAKLLIPSNNMVQLFARDESKFAKVSILPVVKPYLKNPQNKAEVLVIFHSLFKEIAEKYIEIRKKTTNFSFKLIDAEDIYNEFNYGKKSPFAIKELIQFAFNSWQDSLRTVVLIGNASWDPFKRMKESVSTDYLPIYGFPPADFWYTLLDNDDIPDISLGRISISNIQDGNNYLEKLNLYDNIPDQPWMKNFLFLSGGDSPAQRRNFANMKGYFFDDIIKTEPLCGTSDSVSKYDESVGGVSESGVIREKINNGALWVNFVGHANQNVFDMDGWQTYKLNNYGKYSFFSTISCNTGAHADPGIINSRNEDYVFFKDKGFIGSIGSSTFGWVDENRYVVQRMITQMADSNSTLEFIGDLFNYGKNGLANEGAQLETKFHSALIGDPLLRLRVSKRPNLYIYPQEFNITNKDNYPIVNVTDSIAFVNIAIYNNGLKTNSGINLQILDYFQGGIDTLIVKVPEICNSYKFVTRLNIANKPGEHTLKITIDPERNIPELKENNKYFETSFYVYSSSMLMLDPFPQWNVDLKYPLFRLINPNHNPNFKYYFSILNEDNIPVYIGNDSEINIAENYLEWHPEITLIEGQYLLFSYYTDEQGLKSNTIQIPFSAQDKRILSGVTIIQNTANTLSKNTLNQLVYDSLSQSIKIQDILKKVKLISVGGHKDLRSWGNIEVGNDVFTDSEYLRGFNIVTIPVNSDSTNNQFRIYDTWVDGDNWINDSSSVRLVKYLRDSIPDNSYVLIITSGLSWKIPVLNQMYQPSSSGSFDSLKTTLRSFGSALIDSVVGPYTYEDVSWWGWRHSFAMIGKKGWKPGEAIEVMVPTGDSALIEKDLRFIKDSGVLTTPYFGQSKEWKEIVVESNANKDSLENYKLSYEILGRNNNVEKSILNGELLTHQTSINIPDSLNTLFKELNISIKFQRYNENSFPEIKLIGFNFLPLPELAILKSQTLIDDSVRNRGEATIMHITSENLSPRSSADSVLLSIQNITDQGITDFQKIIITRINPNSFSHESITLKNDNLYIKNNFQINLNSDNSVKEFYSFNNKYSIPLNVNEDTTKPGIDVTFDGKYVQDGDFVSQKPLIKIKIKDNSPLSFSDTSKIEVFINGAFIIPDSVDFYYFYCYNNSSVLKSELQIIPRKLEFGTSKLNPSNNIRIIAKDYYGNSDTVLFRVNVSQNNSLSDIITYPNPSKENITFKYSFSSRHLSDFTLLKISNLTGQIIKNENWYSILGENEHLIKLQDDFGKNLPSGIYFYEIAIDSDLWTDPKQGFFIISK